MPQSSSSSPSRATCFATEDTQGSHTLLSKSSIITFSGAAMVSSTPPFDRSPSPGPLDRVNGSPSSLPSASSQTAASIRHHKFWLYDGSIVLHVQNTLFRVHQTILANHSEVFADLFTVPQPDGERTIDGCPIVGLYDDEKDFVDLLNAVYTPECVTRLYHSYELTPTPFLVILKLCLAMRISTLCLHLLKESCD